MIEAEYLDRHGHPMRMLVEPYGFGDRAGQRTLAVWDLEREQYGELAVERIVDARDMGIAFEPRTGQAADQPGQ